MPQRHAQDDRCSARPALQAGTLAGRIIGRPLDKNGKAIADAIRQEHYMEARFELAVRDQQRLAAAARQADGKRFQVPHEFARALTRHAFLGQLDVNPMGSVPGSRNDNRRWGFFGQTVPSPGADTVRVRIEGKSHVATEFTSKIVDVFARIL